MGESGPHGSAFSGRVGWGTRPALLVVDLCRAYTEPDGPFKRWIRKSSARFRFDDASLEAEGGWRNGERLS